MLWGSIQVIHSTHAESSLSARVRRCQIDTMGADRPFVDKAGVSGSWRIREEEHLANCIDKKWIGSSSSSPAAAVVAMLRLQCLSSHNQPTVLVRRAYIVYTIQNVAFSPLSKAFTGTIQYQEARLKWERRCAVSTLRYMIARVHLFHLHTFVHSVLLLLLPGQKCH